MNTLIRFWHVDCVVINQIHYEIKPQGKQKNKRCLHQSRNHTLVVFSYKKWLFPWSVIITNWTCFICARKLENRAIWDDVCLKPARAQLHPEATKPDSPSYSTSPLLYLAMKIIKNPDNTKVKRSISMESEKVWKKKKTRVRSKVDEAKKMKIRIFSFWSKML